jgi:hypothetical protein
MTVNLSMLAGAGAQFFDNSGVILSGGLVFTYLAGTTSPQTAYTSSAGNVAHTNPIVLDSAGRVASGGEIWLTDAVAYKFVLKTSAAVTIGTYDNVTGNASGVESGIYAAFAAPTGSSLIGFIQSGGGALATTVQSKLRQTISVADFGAGGDPAIDATTSIQAAINAAGVNGSVYFPSGTYLLSSTIECLRNQQLIGNGVGNTIIRRYGNYGNTFNFVDAGSANIKKMWLRHGDQPADGATSLSNLATTGSHVRFQNVQGALIEDCWFWRMPNQIDLQQGSLVTINRCNIQGCWNPFYPAGQEGTSGIYVGSSAYIQLVNITNCYFAGSNAGPQNISFVISDNGTQVVNLPSTNAGNQYAVRVDGCEGLIIDNCYMGGNTESNIYISAYRITSQVRISNNFFDSAGYNKPMIAFESPPSQGYPVMVNISDNCFNGELMAYQSIGSLNPYGGQPTMVNFQITGNTMGNNLGSGIFLRNVQGGIIANNVVAAYNARNLTPGTDVNYCTGIYVTDSTSVKIDSNITGGGVNTAGPNAYTYIGVILAGTVINVTEKNTVHNGTGTTGTIRGRVAQYTVTSTSSANYQLLGTEETLVIINSTAAAIQVTPPTLIPIGYAVTVKDGAGNASTNPIQFIGTVDGALNPSYVTNYFSKTLLWNGTQWNVIGN